LPPEKEPDFVKHGMDSPSIEYAQCGKREAANPPPESRKNPAKGQKSRKVVAQGIYKMEKTVTNNSLTPNFLALCAGPKFGRSAPR
jgi:hypothetical protein